MRRTLFILLLGVLPLIAQESASPDSLRSILQNNPGDSIAVEVLLQLSGHYAGSDERSARSYIDSALFLAREADYLHGEVRVFETLASLHKRNDLYDSAVFYYNLCLQLEDQNGNIENQVRLLRDLGIVHYFQGDHLKALDIFRKRLQICEEKDDLSCISSSSNNIAVLLTELGNYEEAIRYNLRSLKIDEETGNQRGVLASHNSLGTVHYYLENYDKSMEHYQKMLDICLALGDQQLNVSYALNNIAGIHYKRKELEKAVEYYERSLEIEKEYGNKVGIAIKYDNLGAVYQDMGDLVRAEDYYVKALALNEETKNFEGVSSNKYKLAELYARENNYPKAITWYLQALPGATESGRLELQKNIQEGLAKTYKAIGNYRMAYESYEAFMQLKDSLLNEESSRQIASLEARYENEKKEREIKLLNQERELNEIRLAEQEAMVQQRSMQRNLLVGGILSVLIVSLLLLRNYQLRLKAREKINQKNKEFEAMRSSFFAGISHEFRTPLTLISAPVNELQQKYGADRDTNWTLQLIKRNANRLLRLINQLLDLSKLEAGKLRLQVSKDDVVHWIRLVAASFESLAVNRDIGFSTQIPEKPFSMFFDREKLEQIVVNLLSNAFKFTPVHGNVALRVIHEGDQLIIEVKNDGDPIPEEERAKIFDRFYQVNDKGRRAEGSGIGLALVKEFCELHHGQVYVTIKGAWTVFMVSLPADDTVYANDDQVELKEKQEENDHQASEEMLPVLPDVPESKSTVLVVEDNADLRSYIEHQLAPEYMILTANDGKAGFDKAIEEIPDLVITDVMMPEMNGIDMLEMLRKDIKTRHIPVVMLTARAEKENRLEGIEKGADHYLSKPFDAEELKVRVKSLLTQRERVRDHFYHEFLTTPKIENITSADDQFLKNAVDILDINLDDSDFMVDRFAHDLGMSRAQLHRKMKAIAGCSTTEFVRNYRLKKAHEYLKGKKGSVSEIAYTVGFNNLSYFTRSFRELFKINPSEVVPDTG